MRRTEVTLEHSPTIANPAKTVNPTIDNSIAVDDDVPEPEDDVPEPEDGVPEPEDEVEEVDELEEAGAAEAFSKSCFISTCP